MLKQSSFNTNSHQLEGIQAELEQELARVLAWWADRLVVPGNERVVGEISNAGIADPSAPVGAVYLSRILWTFSRATEFLVDDRWRRIADIAYAHLCRDFFDPQHGGIFWQCAADGEVISPKKQAYAQAFALYGLSAYARISRDGQTHAICEQLFDLIEHKFLHADQGGYWEAFTREWGEIEDLRLSWRDHHAPMSMNTHLHVMEAYSEYFRSFGGEAVQAALANLVNLFVDRIFVPDKGHMRMFWADDWTDLSTAVSYGHEIEASWLLCEAAELLGERELISKVLPVAFTLVDSCRANGTGDTGDILEEEQGDSEKTRIWWSQAEALVGFLNAYQLRGHAEDLASALASWDFIKRAVIDAPEGEWSWYSKLDEGRENPYIGGEWKACYHNGRALMEAIDRIKIFTG